MLNLIETTKLRKIHTNEKKNGYFRLFRAYAVITCEYISSMATIPIKAYDQPMPKILNQLPFNDPVEHLSGKEREEGNQ